MGWPRLVAATLTTVSWEELKLAVAITVPLENAWTVPEPATATSTAWAG